MGDDCGGNECLFGSCLLGKVGDDLSASTTLTDGDDDMFYDPDADLDMDHSESCAFCDGVVTIFKILTGLLGRMQPHMPPVKYNVALHKLRKSEYNVNFFSIDKWSESPVLKSFSCKPCLKIFFCF